MNVGDIVLAKVTGITKYGFFIEVNNYSGLCHISDISNKYVDDINRYVSIEDKIYVLITDINDDIKQLKVSIKDISYNEFTNNKIIKETKKGFLPLKEMLPVWIEEKIKEYDLDDSMKKEMPM